MISIEKDLSIDPHQTGKITPLELKKYYRQAQEELEKNPESFEEINLWEQTTGDGLEPDDWE